jgi:hypothetical protein
MYLDYIGAARHLMQPVDILRYDYNALCAPIEGGDSGMRGVWLSVNNRFEDGYGELSK